MPDTRVHLANPIASNADVEAQMRRLSRRSFTVGALAALVGTSGLGWLTTRSPADGVPWPLRRMLGFNEQIAQRLFSPRRLAPEFSRDRAVELRVNGDIGLQSPVTGGLKIVRVIGKLDRQIPLTAIRQLPASEMTTELKCIEGWSQIAHWKGVRLADFLDRFGGPSQYVALSTPLGGKDPTGRPDRYYVGLDRPSAVHPQTLLCYEINGQPLTEAHGAPLRLVSTTKYGTKCIKRVGVIELTDSRPADYWASAGMTGTLVINSAHL